MYFLRELTRRYGESYGLPFAAQLPHMDANSVSFQFGFVGQQPGIGYQLLRYGDLYQDQEAWEKGRGILDFWVKNAMTKSGAPAVCYHPAIGGWEPYPFWTRMIADGMEAILDGWLYLHKKAQRKMHGLPSVRKRRTGMYVFRMRTAVTTVLIRRMAP